VPTLIDHNEHFPVKDFSILIDRVLANADEDGATPDDALRADATVAAGPDGVYVKVVGGTGLQAAEMKQVFERARAVEFQRDVEERRTRYGDAAAEHPLPRSASQRRFAAHYAIHLAWASSSPGAQRPRADRERPLQRRTRRTVARRPRSRRRHPGAVVTIGRTAHRRP